MEFVKNNPSHFDDVENIKDSIDGTGATPLLCACKSTGDPATIRRIIREKADVEKPDNEGWSPLRWAARYGRLKAAEVLIMEGADIHGSDRKAKTALHWAAASGHDEMCKLLLDKKAAVNAKTREHQRVALHGAAQNGHASTVAVLIG